MLFVIDNLKYDTDKMKLISTKCEYRWKGSLTGLYFDASTDHRKFMRMMPVYVRITAPLYW